MQSQKKLAVRNKLILLLSQKQKIDQIKADLSYLENMYQKDSADLVKQVAAECPDLFRSPILINSEEIGFINDNVVFEGDDPIIFTSLANLNRNQ